MGAKKKNTVWLWILLGAVFVLAAIAVPVCMLYSLLDSMETSEEKIAQVDEKAAAYIAEQYPGNDFIVEQAVYVFKDNSYRVHVRSRSSQDTYFYLDFDWKTLEFERDSYESQVLEKRNTLARIRASYESAAKAALENMAEEIRASAGVCRYSETTSINARSSPKGLDVSTLVLDQSYDIFQMGQQYGYVEITIIESEDNIHLEKILEYLQKAGSLLEEQGAGYYVMDLTLQNGEYPNDTVTLEIYGVKKEDLEAEDPLARLREMWEAQEAHREQVRQGWED